MGTHCKVSPTEASAAGRHYRAANGSVIRNYGQRVVTGRTEEGTLVSMPIQVADVGKVLGSVREMVNHGNRVVFDVDGSYIENKWSKDKLWLREDNGVYVLDMLVTPNNESGFGRPAPQS